MKRKCTMILDQVTDAIFTKFKELCETFNVDKSNWTIVVYPSTAKRIPESVRCDCGEATTNFYYDTDENGYVKLTGGYIFISFEEIMLALIDLGSIDECIKYFQMVITHEVGHIVDMTNRFSFMTMEEVDADCDENEQLRKGMGHTRANASATVRLNWLRRYNELPAEASANKAVGLSVYEILELERRRLAASQEYAKMVRRSS